MTAVTFTVDLDHDRITKAGTLIEWVAALNVDHDVFVGRDDVAWPDVFHVIALAYLSGGDFAEFVTGSGWDVD